MKGHALTAAQESILRDEFAKAALLGVVASAQGGVAQWSDLALKSAATNAYAIADAMIKERAK